MARYRVSPPAASSSKKRSGVGRRFCTPTEPATPDALAPSNADRSPICRYIAGYRFARRRRIQREATVACMLLPPPPAQAVMSGKPGLG